MGKQQQQQQLCSPVQRQITLFCQRCDLRLGVRSYRSLFGMLRGNALNEMTLKEEEGADVPLRREIYRSCGVNPAGEIVNIWLLQKQLPDSSVSEKK